MKILVTGGAGYLGSILIPKLLMRGHTVRVVDIGYFGLGHLRSLHPSVQLIREDLRRVLLDLEFRDQLLNDCQCVIHLAAISNDPSAELHPELTEEVNFQTTVSLAEAAKAKGIRFLFSSSCSVYGEAEGDLTEDGVVNPLTVYATSKVSSEQALFALATDNWRPVILRNGTLFGYSTRMRFDLVVNIFALYSTLHNQIRVFGDGLQWRPFLSVQDCARAFVYFAEKKEPSHICYNIATENLRVVDVAAMFQSTNPTLKVTYVPTQDPDRRDYRVSAKRMQDEGFQPRIDVAAGAEGIAEAIICGMIPDPESIFYRNAKWLKELTHIGDRDHRQVVDLMESFSTLNRVAATV
jgi:nucleoside-diphosphate-sugar epimerase